MNPRILKIEAHGDTWRGKLKPKIRLMGFWLERMGFPPERHVEVSLIEPGLLQLKIKPLGTEKSINGFPVQDGKHALALYSYEHCTACIEQLKEDRRTAFSAAWRQHCRREIAEWEAYVEEHYPDHRL